LQGPSCLSGQEIGTFEHSDDAVDCAATPYEKLTFVRQVEQSLSIFGVFAALLLFLRYNKHSGAGRRHKPHRSMDGSSFGS
jgi:hypothetical protein